MQAWICKCGSRYLAPKERKRCPECNRESNRKRCLERYYERMAEMNKFDMDLEIKRRRAYKKKYRARKKRGCL